jgi:hypothetical protein
MEVTAQLKLNMADLTIAIQGASEVAKTILPKIASGTAGAAAASAFIKSSGGMPLAPRIASTAVLAGKASLGTLVGIKAGSSIEEMHINDAVLNSIKTSNHSNIDPNRVPSPNPDIGIPSVLENSEVLSPLQNLLYDLFTYGLIFLLLLFLISYIIFIKHVYSFINKYIINLINKYLLGKINNHNNII